MVCIYYFKFLLNLFNSSPCNTFPEGNFRVDMFILIYYFIAGVALQTSSATDKTNNIALINSFPTEIFFL